MTMTWAADVNVWLALSFESHAHHQSAIAWRSTASDLELVFCRVTQQGFLRIATNPKAFGSEALKPQAAWAAFDAMVADPAITLVEEPAGLEEEWRRLSVVAARSPSDWTDAYLAAFALASGCGVVSFDAGFERFSGLDFHLLL